jgi:DNA-binding SARP family transcriptional activator
VRIYTLGRFKIVNDGKVVAFTGKQPRKPLALLKAIIAFGGLSVREERLIDALWPDAQGDSARFSLTSAIHRLRRVFGQREVVLRGDGRLSLDQKVCWIDIWEIERLLDRIEAIPVSRDGDQVLLNETVELVRQAAELYRGPFLDGENDAPWTSTLADQVRRRLLKQLTAVGEHWQARERWHEATICYEKGLTIDPCAEDVCRRLMGAYQRLGQNADILRAYHHCRDALASGLGIKPAVETDSLLRKLVGLNESL